MHTLAVDPFKLKESTQLQCWQKPIWFYSLFEMEIIHMAGPQVILTPLIITPDTEQHFGRGAGGGYDVAEDFHLPYAQMNGALESLRKQNLRGRLIASLGKIERDWGAAYAEKRRQAPAETEQEMSAAGLTATSPSTVSAIQHQKSIIEALINDKKSALHEREVRALGFSGGNPLQLSDPERARVAVDALGWNLRTFPELAQGQQKRYGDAFTAAHQALVLGAALEVLHQKNNQLNTQLALARELEAEAARVAALENARRIAAEQAAEQARQAAIVEAIRQKELASETKRVQEELTRMAAQAEANRIAFDVAERERLAQVEVAARRAADEAEQQRQMEDSARAAADALAIKRANSYRLSGGGSVPQLVTPAGSIAIAVGASLTLDTALAGVVERLKAAIVFAGAEAAGLSATFLGGVALLTYSPSLSNGERFPGGVLTLPARRMAAGSPEELTKIAAENGTVDLPYRIAAVRSQYWVVNTGVDGEVSSKTPVRLVSFDVATGEYYFTTPDAPPRNLNWTPIADPESASTELPISAPLVPVFKGAVLNPIVGAILPFPASHQPDFQDCIYCFPADSGLEPIYAVFAFTYPGATTVGTFTGRLYNPENAGGPVATLDWAGAKVTQQGIDQVLIHLSRFGNSAANSIMVDRLRKIEAGHSQASDTDKRFYTHELRELERYRALGIADGALVDDEGATWNDTHTATLEDYRVEDKLDYLYTAEALKAEYDALQEEFK